MSKDSVTPYKMNLPTDLKDRLTEAAARSGRSLSSEIITRLEASVAISDRGGIDFTLDGIETFIREAVDDAVDDLREKVRGLEHHTGLRDPYND